MYAALRKLGARPGEQQTNTFTLQSHQDRGLSSRESAEIIADYFATISQEYEPINIDNFSPNIKHFLSQPNMADVPILEEYQVYKKLRKAKKPNSSVKGDLPKRVVQEFSCELSAPVTVIFNSILKNFQYPRQWVVEYQIPLPKTYPPSCEDDLRNIAKTAFNSKVFESFLSDWLLPIVGPYIDPCQYGLKGASITHYLFKLLQFIHEHLDLRDPHAVVLATVDLSKAFNRVSHSMVIEDLYNMHVPAWLLLILISYLTNRTMILHYNGEASSPRDLPGSSPQGAFLGIFFFIIKYNAAALRPVIPRLTHLTEPVDCNKRRRNCKLASCNKHTNNMHALYLDDLSEAEAVNLKKHLIKDPVKRPYPLNFHERTEHVFPQSSLQSQLLKIENFTISNKMKINTSKSNIMIFNKAKNFDFQPEYAFRNGQTLSVIEETRVLGIQLRTDLRWSSNVKSIYKRAMSKMWLLRRMKVLNLEPRIILEYYLKEIRVLAEQAVPIWNSGLTKKQVDDLERIQKVALKIILAEKYENYQNACKTFNLENMATRRLTLSTNFAVRLYKSDRSSQFFTHAKQNSSRRDGNRLVVEDMPRTKRCYNAPHNYLSRLVNLNAAKIRKTL